MARWKVCIIGAGVIGLGSATYICDLTVGLRPVELTLISETFWPDLTSNVAGGIWHPYSIGNPQQQEQVKKWAGSTRDHILKLYQSEDGAKAGTCVYSGYILEEDKTHSDDDIFKNEFISMRRMNEKELSMFPSFRCGNAVTSVMANPQKYMPYLMEKLRKKNVKFLKKKVENFNELAKDYDVIVNCTGVGAAKLNDRTVYPGRGQVIKVAAPWVKHFVLAHKKDSDGHYILPCPDYVLLGGTMQRGDWTPTVREKDRKHIWEGCCRILPSLKEAQILEEAVGLRPMRDSIRLEAEQITTDQGKKWVVHNYGHGGAGITTHWGCGEEAARLVKECLQKIPPNAKL